MTDDEGKYICFDCVGEPYLSAQIKERGQARECSYCGETLSSIPVEDLADRIETAFADHFVRTADLPNSWQERLMADRESTYNWWREGQPVNDAIEDAVSIPSEAARDVQEILDERHGSYDSDGTGEETEFSSDSHYEERGASAQGWHAEWNSFEQSLSTEARFFSRNASDLLALVFGGIDKLKTEPQFPIVVEAGPEAEFAFLFRARVFQADSKLKEALCRPDVHLAAPPARMANAGRMNARGISVFYGATRPEVALAEVRPPVGSNVAVAKFEITRPLRLLDLTALDSVHDRGSIFDPTLKTRLERVAFLKTLGERLTRPVMPDDEAFDYLATQAVADFLATQNDPRLDGIMFDSAQAETGRNVVLFQKAARTEAIELPAGTEISVRFGHTTEDDEWEVDYGVTEEVPPAKNVVASSEDDGDLFSLLVRPHEFFDSDADYRDPALRVDTTSIEVHHVDWVKVNTTAHPVGRIRWEKRETEF